MLQLGIFLQITYGVWCDFVVLNVQSWCTSKKRKLNVNKKKSVKRDE